MPNKRHEQSLAEIDGTGQKEASFNWLQDPQPKNTRRLLDDTTYFVERKVPSCINRHFLYLALRHIDEVPKGKTAGDLDKIPAHQ